MNLLITLVVACVVFYLLYLLIGYLPNPPVGQPVKNILYILLILIAVVWLLSNFLPGFSLPNLPARVAPLVMWNS